MTRIRLKMQVHKTTKAQLNERKAADSKYRLTSYVFHDKSAISPDLLSFLLFLYRSAFL